MFLVSFLRSEIIIIILTIGVVLFQKRKKKSKSKFPKKHYKNNVLISLRIVLFLFKKVYVPPAKRFQCLMPTLGHTGCIFPESTE